MEGNYAFCSVYLPMDHEHGGFRGGHLEVSEA